MAYKVTLRLNPSASKVFEVDDQGNIISMEQPIGYSIKAFNELVAHSSAVAQILLNEGMEALEIEKE